MIAEELSVDREN